MQTIAPWSNPVQDISTSILQTPLTTIIPYLAAAVLFAYLVGGETLGQAFIRIRPRGKNLAVAKARHNRNCEV